MILKAGASVNQYDESGETPLHIACKYSFVAIARLLLEYRANPCAKNKVGVTPLHYSAENGNLGKISAISITLFARSFIMS